MTTIQRRVRLQVRTATNVDGVDFPAGMVLNAVEKIMQIHIHGVVKNMPPEYSAELSAEQFASIGYDVGPHILSMEVILTSAVNRGDIVSIN